MGAPSLLFIPFRQVELADYDLTLKHKPGKENKIADALSRRPDYDTGENDNKGIVILPETMFIKSTTLKDPPPPPP